MNFQQSYLYWLAGLILLIVALMSFRDKANPRRITTGLFWGIYGLLFLLGNWTYELVGDKRTVHIAVGLAVVGLALIAGFGGVRLGSYHQRTTEERETSAKRLGNRLFLPALAIPVVTVVGVLMFNHIPGLQETLFGPGNHATLVTLFSMTVGSLIGLAMAIKMTHEKVHQPLQERAVCSTPSAGPLFCRRSSPPLACCLLPPGSGRGSHTSPRRIWRSIAGLSRWWSMLWAWRY